MIVVSGNVVLAQAGAGLDPDVPVVGWHNILVAGSVTADTQEANYPASNLANPATNLEWRAADASEQFLTIETGEVDAIDYVGIARHNFGSAEVAVSVERLDGADWVEVLGPVMPADDSPLILRFAAQSIAQLRIRLQEGEDNPRAAVVYVGKLLDLERKIYAGHVPLTDARRISVANNRSESGNFLGRIVTGEWRETRVPLSLISPDWFRANVRPFLAAAAESPFFFAWRPASYPAECGYAWFTGDPDPAPAGPSNLIAFEWAMNGIV